MSAAFKAQGNAHFAKKEWDQAAEYYSQAIEAESDPVSAAALFSNRSAAYVHLDKLEQALADAHSCIERRPIWSKGYARLGEVAARQQVFEQAIFAYEKAIQRAEDTATKARYVTALKTAQVTKDRNRRTYMQKSGHDMLSTMFERSPVYKLQRAIQQGFRVQTGNSSLLLMGYAANTGAEGFQKLEECVVRVGDRVHGQTGTAAHQLLSECLLLDMRAFIIPPGSDPSFPLVDKLSGLTTLEAVPLDIQHYLEPRRKSAKEIVADLNRRLPQEGWETVREVCSVLSRGKIIDACVSRMSKEYGNAIQDIRFGIDILEEGNRVWADVNFDDKGQSFRPTMIRVMKCYLMETLLDASRDAFSESTRKAFPIEAVEATAQQVLDENPESEWPTDLDPSDVTGIAYYILPTARAYLGLAYAASRRALAPVAEGKIASGNAALADLAHARKAAKLYDLAAKYLPNDDARRPQALFMSLEQHLRAGGKKVSEVFKLADEAEKLRAELSRFFDELEGSFTSRDFVRYQVDALRDWLGSPGARPFQGVPAIDQVVKPIPTLNLVGTSRSFNPNAVLDAPFWLALEGQVGIADVLGLDREVRGDCA
ncbi:hypothetical protein JCM11491_003418 [Sporobolomyces phaffii]